MFVLKTLDQHFLKILDRRFVLYVWWEFLGILLIFWKLVSLFARREVTWRMGDP